MAGQRPKRKVKKLNIREEEEASVLDWLKLRVLSCYQEAVMLKNGQMPPPRMAIVYPTYVCNHNCRGCDYSEQNRLKVMYTKDQFKSLIDQLQDIGVKAIEFCGGGEPTLHPDLPEMIDWIINYGISFGLLTNGTNLNEKIRKRLISHGSYCRISLESATEKTFNLYKRPSNENAGFKKVVGNIRKLIKERNNHNPKPKLQISMKFSVDKNNYLDAPQALSLGKKLRVDSVQFKLIRNMPSEIKDKKTIDWLYKQIERAKTKFPNLRVMPDFAKSILRTKCWLSPLQVTIDPFGDAFICCYYRHRLNKHRLGNVFKDGLKNIWFSKTHWEKINQINPKDCNKYDCRFHYYNELMEALVIKDIGQLYFI